MPPHDPKSVDDLDVYRATERFASFRLWKAYEGSEATNLSSGRQGLRNVKRPCGKKVQLASSWKATFTTERR